MPAPAPRFSRTAPSTPDLAADPAGVTRASLLTWGIAEEKIADLAQAGVIVGQ